MVELKEGRQAYAGCALLDRQASAPLDVHHQEGDEPPRLYIASLPVTVARRARQAAKAGVRASSNQGLPLIQPAVPAPAGGLPALYFDFHFITHGVFLLMAFFLR